MRIELDRVMQSGIVEVISGNQNLIAQTANIDDQRAFKLFDYFPRYMRNHKLYYDIVRPCEPHKNSSNKNTLRVYLLRRIIFCATFGGIMPIQIDANDVAGLKWRTCVTQDAVEVAGRAEWFYARLAEQPEVVLGFTGSDRAEFLRHVTDGTFQFDS